MADADRPILPATAIDLADPAGAWRIVAGHVDLFAIEPSGDDAPGRRRPLFAVPEGEAVVGMDLADAPVGLFALPSLGARVEPLARPLPADLRDAWAARVARLIVAGGGGRVHRLDPGDAGELPAEERIGGGTTPGWLVAEGPLRIGGDIPLPAGQALWWGEPLWADAPDPVELSLSPAPPADGDGLASLHALALVAVARRLSGQADGDEIAWRDARREDEAAFARGIAQLSEAGKARPSTSDDAWQNEPALADALRPLLRALGVPQPSRVRDAADPGEALERHGLRGRRVLLRAGWRAKTSEPLLAQFGAHPVALLPGRAGWRIVGREIDAPLDDALAASLAPEAWQVYRGFAARPLRNSDLLALGFGRSWGDIARVAALAFAGSWAGAAIPMGSREVFDTLVPTADMGGLIGVVALLVTVAVAQAGFQVANALALLRIEMRFEAHAMPALMDRLLRQGAGFFRTVSAGDLTNRLLGIQSARQMIATSLTIGLFAASMLISSMAVLFRLDVGMALAAFGCAVAIGLVNLGIQRLQFRAAKVGGHSRGLLDGFVLQLIAGMAKLRAAAAERRAMAQWAEKFSRLSRKNIEARRYMAAQQMFDAFLPVAASALLFWIIAGGERPRLSSGEIVAFAIAFGQLVSALVQISLASSQITLVAPTIGRLKPLLQTLPEARPDAEPPGKLDGEIVLHHLGFRYGPATPLVLDDLSATIPAGAFVAFVGASGSGKSTLFRCLLGFETPEAGEILFDRRPMEELDVTALRRQIGVVLQHGRISSGSILDNIAGPVAVSASAAWAAARAVGLDRDIEAMPMGMHTVLMDGGGALSGGQRQRLLIARALMHDPRILLFDEATSALDNRTQAIVTETLKRLSITRIVIAHRLSTVADVDRIFVMERGRVVQAGTYAELIDAPGPFAELARRQLAETQ